MYNLNCPLYVFGHKDHLLKPEFHQNIRRNVRVRQPFFSLEECLAKQLVKWSIAQLDTTACVFYRYSLCERLHNCSAAYFRHNFHRNSSAIHNALSPGNGTLQSAVCACADLKDNSRPDALTRTRHNTFCCSDMRPFLIKTRTTAAAGWGLRNVWLLKQVAWNETLNQQRCAGITAEGETVIILREALMRCNNIYLNRCV